MKKLFVGGLPFSADNSALAALFRPFGSLNAAYIVVDKVMHRSKGFGFVEFADDRRAMQAIAALDGSDLDGRSLVVNEARFVSRSDASLGSPVELASLLLGGVAATIGAKTGHTSLDPASMSLGVVAASIMAQGSRFSEYLQHRPIIEVTDSVSVKLMKYIQANPTELLRMDRRRFEELIAQIWSGFGFTVELTQRTRDGGVDVIAIRKEHVNERFLIECKRPDPGKPVGIAPVRALFGVLVDQRATRGILATTAHFSKDATIFFEDHKWQLEGKDFGGIQDWINQYLRIKS